MTSAPPGSRDKALQIRLLGELQVYRKEVPCPLPASRKTRALLAYLAANARRHLRSELCGLFWEDAEDPRAALRWSLTQLRRVLDQRGTSIIHADRESIELRGQAVGTDLEHLSALTGRDIGSAPIAALQEAAALFRGEFLNGLELPGCYRYYEWCGAERESAGRVHEQILTALVERLGSNAKEALVHARALVARNPLNEHGHIAVMRCLAALGRKREARTQYEQCCRIFKRELGLPPSVVLEAARRELDLPREVRGDESGAGAAEASAARVAAPQPRGLVDRDDEVAQFRRAVEGLRTGRATEVLLLSGPAGIGKTRLLDELVHQIADAGGIALRGRAFEAEMIRPFGFWIDVLRALGAGELPASHVEALSSLLQSGATEAVADNRARLFDAVVAALAWLAERKPLAVVVDDLQWIEKSSTALLHFAMRQLAGHAVLFAMAARAGELEDNAAAQTLIAALAQDKRLRRIALDPLPGPHAKTLVRSVAPDIEPDAIVARAQGNPLYLIELARAGVISPGSRSPLDEIFDGRLGRLSHGAGELLQWASAVGGRFSLELLIEACGVELATAGPWLAELERHDFICCADDADYDFSHDLIQQAAYRRVSQPRRRLMHKRIAGLLSRQMVEHPEIAVDVAHHAALGEQHELAAQASVAAGEHGLRLFANRETTEIARRGMRHAERVADDRVRASLGMALLRIQVLAGSASPPRGTSLLAQAVNKTIEEAKALRLHAEVAQGYYLLSVIAQESGELTAAQDATLQAAEAAKATDGLTRARQLANTARCLVELGRDIGPARTLIDQARRLANSAGVNEVEVHWASGLLHNWDGDLDQAAQDMAQAVELARDAEDRWRECRCLGWLAMIELERRRPQQAIARASELKRVAQKLGEGADAPLAEAIEVLARRMSGDHTAELDGAFSALRAADDKSRLAYVLNLAASIQLQAGEMQTAAAIAADALSLAEAIGERNESALAHATLAEVAIAGGDAAQAERQLETLRALLETPGLLSVKAVSAITRASNRLRGRRVVAAAK